MVLGLAASILDNPSVKAPPPNRIRELRVAKSLSQGALGRLVHPKTTAQQIGRLENGSRELTESWMRRIAQILEVAPSDLLSEAATLSRRTVPLVGYAGKADLYYPDPDAGPWIGFAAVDAPPANGCHAIQVRGDHMAPVYRNGDILYFSTERGRAADCVGQDCIVQVDGGGAYIKRIDPGTRSGKYNLVSYGGEPVMESVAVEWASPIVWVKRG